MLMAQAEERCARMSFEALVEEVQERLGIADSRQEGLMAMAQLMFENRPMVNVILEELKRRHGRLLDARKSERCEMEDLKRQLEVLRACLDQEKQNALPALEESSKWKQRWEEAKVEERKMQEGLKAAQEEAERCRKEAQRVIEVMKRQERQPVAVDTAAEKLKASEAQNRVLEEEKAKIERQLARLTFELRSCSRNSIENKCTTNVESPANSTGEVEGPFRQPCKELNAKIGSNVAGEGIPERGFNGPEHETRRRQPTTNALDANEESQNEDLLRKVVELNSSTVSSSAERLANDAANEQVMDSDYCSAYQGFDASTALCGEGKAHDKEAWADKHYTEFKSTLQALVEDVVDLRCSASTGQEIGAGSKLPHQSLGSRDLAFSPPADSSAKTVLRHSLSVLRAIHEELVEVKGTLYSTSYETRSAAIVQCTGQKESDSLFGETRSRERSPRDLITSLGMAYNPEGGDIFQYKEPEVADPLVQEKYTIELKESLVADLKHTLDLPNSALPLCAIETAIAFLKGEVIHVDETRLDVIRTISTTISSTADREHTFKVSFLKLKAIIVEMSGEQRSGGNWSIADSVIREIAKSKDLRHKLLSSLVWLVVAWECMDLEAKKHLLTASEFLANAHWLVLLGRVCVSGVPVYLNLPPSSGGPPSPQPKKKRSWLFRSRH